MMKFRISLLLLSVLLFGGCSSAFRPASSSAPPPPPTFEDGFRNERHIGNGVPLLYKIPFLNRLFTDVRCVHAEFFWDFPIFQESLSAAVSDDGVWLLVGKSYGGAVSIFNLLDATNHTTDLVPSRNDSGFDLGKAPDLVPGSQVTWLAMLPDNSAFLAYRVRNNPETPVLETMELFNRETGLLLRAFPIEPGFQAATLSPDGQWLHCAGQTLLETWNVQTGEKVASIPLGTQEGVTQLQCSQNSPWLFLATQSGNVRIFDGNTLTEAACLSTGSEPMLIDISPDGKTLMVACSQKIQADSTVPYYCNYCNIRLYEIGSWNLLREITPVYPHACDFINICFSRDGSRLIGRGRERIETPAETTVGSFLAEYDLAEPSGQSNGEWKKLEYVTLPLHPEGKFLLDGRNRSGSDLSPWSERF